MQPTKRVLSAEPVQHVTELAMLVIGGPNTGKTLFVQRFMQTIHHGPATAPASASGCVVSRAPAVVVQDTPYLRVTVSWAKVRWGLTPDASFDLAARAAVNHCSVHAVDLAFVFVTDLANPSAEAELADRLRPFTIPILVVPKCDSYPDGRQTCTHAVHRLPLLTNTSPCDMAFTARALRRAVEVALCADQPADGCPVASALVLDLMVRVEHIVTRQAVISSGVSADGDDYIFACLVYHVGLHSLVKSRTAGRASVPSARSKKSPHRNNGDALLNLPSGAGLDSPAILTPPSPRPQKRTVNVLASACLDWWS